MIMHNHRLFCSVMPVMRYIPAFLLLLVFPACNRTSEQAQNDSVKQTASKWSAPGQPEAKVPGAQSSGSKKTEGRRNIKEPTIEAIFFTQATAMKNAHNSRNYDEFLRYAVVPGMSTNAAHRDKLIARLKQEDTYLEQQSVRVDSLVIMPAANLAEKAGTYFALMPKKMYLTVKGKRNLNEGFLLGYTNDGGRQCYFVDLDNVSEEALYQLLPDLNGLIPWPGPGKTYQLSGKP